MRIVGLTGGIASGKTTVSRLLQERGYPVVDADRLSRDVLLPGEPALSTVIEHFGASILSPDGTIDRRALGRIVFEDDAARARLNAIIHPAVAMRSAQVFAEWAQAGYRLGFYDAALLYETGSYRQFPLVILVAAPFELQLARLVERDPDLSEAEARARIGAQMPLEEKVARADIVIHNDADLDTLRERVDAAIEQVHVALSLSHKGPLHG